MKPAIQLGERFQVVLFIGQEQRRIESEPVEQEAADDVGNLPDGKRSGQVPRHFVKRPGLLLLERGAVGLPAQSGSELAGDQGDREHDGKCHQILGVVDREREPRRHKEEVEQGDAEECRQHRRAAAEFHPDQQHHQQE